MEFSFQIFENEYNRFFHVFEKLALIFSLCYCSRKLDTLTDKIATLLFPHMNAERQFRHSNPHPKRMIRLVDTVTDQ